jgi:hypothetical protein
VCTSASQFGPRPGLVGEDESPDPTVNHLVRYTSAKLRAELLLQRELPADQLLVIRPPQDIRARRTDGGNVQPPMPRCHCDE